MNKKKALRLIPFAIAFFIFALFITVLFGFFISPNARYHSSRSLSDYSQCIGRSHPKNCLLFPDRLLLSNDNCEFYDVFWQNGYDTPEFLTYAFCCFSEKEFENEVNRLSGLAKEYTETFFERPAYILYYNRTGYREYALVDEGHHSIHYICCSRGRFLSKLPVEDRIKPQYEDLRVSYNTTDGDNSSG